MDFRLCLVFLGTLQIFFTCQADEHTHTVSNCMLESSMSLNKVVALYCCYQFSYPNQILSFI